VSQSTHLQYELAAAKAAAARLQESAAGGTPVAIPGAVDAAPTSVLEPPPAPNLTAVPDSTPQLPSTEDDREEDRLEGGGRL